MRVPVAVVAVLGVARHRAALAVGAVMAVASAVLAERPPIRMGRRGVQATANTVAAVAVAAIALRL
jgi:hypothetical protein